MMIEQELINQKLFELMEHKDLGSLSDEERAFVLRQMNEQEYASQREAILMITETESKTVEFTPDSSVAKSLFKEEKTNWIDIIKSIFYVKVPALALVVPVVIAGFFFFKNEPSMHDLYTSSDKNKLDTAMVSIDTTKQSVTSVSVRNNPYSKYVSPLYRY